MSFHSLITCFLALSKIPLIEYDTACFSIYHRRTSQLLSSFGNCEKNCYNHPCACYCMDARFQLQGARLLDCMITVLLPGKSHGRRSLVGCSPWGWEESDMTERRHFHFSLLCIGEGNGNPLQCSCLENPRDGVAPSWTQPK